MSQGLNSPFAPHSSTPIAAKLDAASRSAAQPAAQALSSATAAGPSTWQPPPHWNLDQPGSSSRAKKLVKSKPRLPEEQEIITQTAARIASRLASDHAAVLKPDVDSPFADYADVVDRLLPYHVFQQPQEDVAKFAYDIKGKGKATESDIRAEIAETKFALECYKRKEALKRRYRKALARSAKRMAYDDQTYVLAQTVLDADRVDMTWLNNELRAARAELDKIEKDKRAIANASRATTMQNAYAHYYRSYPYTYAQPYGASASTPSSSMSTFSVIPSVPAPVATSYHTGAAIPVQLPVASLPALHALGIVPVPASSLPEGQAQPPAVLRGSTANGTMLSLEINVSLLQSAQMSGLAMVLNSLMSRSSIGSTGSSPSSSSVTSGASKTNAGPGG